MVCGRVFAHLHLRSKPTTDVTLLEYCWVAWRGRLGLASSWFWWCKDKCRWWEYEYRFNFKAPEKYHNFPNKCKNKQRLKHSGFVRKHVRKALQHSGFVRKHLATCSSLRCCKQNEFQRPINLQYRKPVGLYEFNHNIPTGFGGFIAPRQ